MEQRTYTQKELYQFVTEYSREAREEGFDMSVGDFVDWVASRDEAKEYRHSCSGCGRDFIIWHYIDTDRPMCDAYWSKWTGYKKSSKPCKYVPVLPEKLEVPLFMGAKDTEDIEIIQFLMRVIAKQNEILDYLKEKNL